MKNRNLPLGSKLLASALISFFSFSAKADLFTASDVSVLWPLKASAEKDPVFLKTGDGFCNAPSLSEGSIFPKETFDKFTAIAFNGAQNECKRDSNLEDQFFFVPDDEVLKQDVHLSLVKGIAPTACNYDLWKITGMRFDPCRPGSKCNNVIRLVAQPFEKQSNGLWAVRDFTIHLSYNISDVPSFMSDLKQMATIARQVESTEAWDPLWDSNRQVLRPHHALRNELNTCGGPFSVAIRSLIKTWATRKNLFMASWMTSSLALKEWTFGEVRVSNDGQDLSPVQNFGRSFFNFSDSLLQNGKPATTTSMTNLPSANLAKQLSLAGVTKLPPNESSPEMRTAQIDTVLRILEPKKTSQSAGDCVSCHLAPQILERIRALYNSPGAVGSGEFRTVVWPGFLREPRTFAQLRNFGYGPQFQLAVNRRTINETQDIFDMLPQLTSK